MIVLEYYIYIYIFFFFLVDNMELYILLLQEVMIFKVGDLTDLKQV